MRPLITSILASSLLVQSSFASGDIFDDFAFGTVWAGGWDKPDDYYDAATTVRVTKTKYVCPCETTGLASTTTTSASYGGGPGSSTTTGTGSLSTTVTSTIAGSSSTTVSTSGTGSTTSTGTTSGTGTTISTGTTSGTGTTTSTGSTSGTSTTSSTSSTSVSSTLSTTTSTTTVVTRTQTTSYVPKQTDTFNFKAYGNPFVADGTSLSDVFVLRTDFPDRGYGLFNNGGTNFYIDANGALVDQQTGGQACVYTGSNPAVIRFATPGYLNDNTTPDYGQLSVCVCQATSLIPVTCLCDGKTEFAVDYRSYLYIRSAVAVTSSSTSTFPSSFTTDTSSTTTISSTDSSSTDSTTTTADTTTPAAKRGLEYRQATTTAATTTTQSSTSSSTTNTATTPVAVTVSAASATTTVTPTTCQYPLQTLNIVSNGSAVNPGNTSFVATYADGTYMKQLDWNTANHWQYGGFVNGSFNDPNNTANGFYGGNFTYDRCSGLIQETTYGRIICAGPGKRQFGALFIMPYDKIIADGGDLCVCSISAANAISCQCGPSNTFQTSSDGELWLGNGTRANYAINYPRAVILN